MDKTIRVGSFYTENGYDGVYIWSPRNCVGWIPFVGARTTKEFDGTDDDPSLLPDKISRDITAREAISLHKAAVELGMNEHEDVTYWLRDYVVEKIREAQAIS